MATKELDPGANAPVLHTAKGSQTSPPEAICRVWKPNVDGSPSTSAPTEFVSKIGSYAQMATTPSTGQSVDMAKILGRDPSPSSDRDYSQNNSETPTYTFSPTESGHEDEDEDVNPKCYSQDLKSVQHRETAVVENAQVNHKNDAAKVNIISTTNDVAISHLQENSDKDEDTIAVDSTTNPSTNEQDYASKPESRLTRDTRQMTPEYDTEVERPRRTIGVDLSGCVSLTAPKSRNTPTDIPMSGCATATAKADSEHECLDGALINSISTQGESEAGTSSQSSGTIESILTAEPGITVKEEPIDQPLPLPSATPAANALAISNLKIQISCICAQKKQYRAQVQDHAQAMKRYDVAASAADASRATNKLDMDRLVSAKRRLESQLVPLRVLAKNWKAEADQWGFRSIQEKEKRNVAQFELNQLGARKKELKRELGQLEYETELNERFPDKGARELARKLERGEKEGEWVTVAQRLADGEGDFEDLLLFQEELFDVDAKVKLEDGETSDVPKKIMTQHKDTSSSDPSMTSTPTPPPGDEENDKTKAQIKTEFEDDELITFKMIQESAQNACQEIKRVRGMMRVIANGKKRKKSDHDSESESENWPAAPPLTPTEASSNGNARLKKASQHSCDPSTSRQTSQKTSFSRRPSKLTVVMKTWIRSLILLISRIEDAGTLSFEVILLRILICELDVKLGI